MLHVLFSLEMGILFKIKGKMPETTVHQDEYQSLHDYSGV